MVALNSIQVTGNLVDDPELRFTPTGKAVANFRLASTPKVFDRDKQEWGDGDTLFIGGSVWGEFAENVAESLRRGDRVTVTGTLNQRNWETKEGEKRSTYEIQVETIGPDLRWVTAELTKKEKKEEKRPTRGRKSAR